MAELTRRQVLQRLLGGAGAAAGVVILARAELPAQVVSETTSSESPPAPEQRADRLAAEAPSSGRETHEPVGFLNVGFRPGGLGGWRNGGWFNGGGWRNGGWHNGGWRNGGWNNGLGWRNGGWPNGGWLNGGGWRNFW